MKTSLEILLENLNLGEEQRTELYKNLRSLDIHDDNDPLIKISLVLSIIAKFVGEVPERMVYERQSIENILKEQKDIGQKLSMEINDFKKSLPSNTIQETNSQSAIKDKKNIYNRLHIAIVILITLMGLVFNYCYTSNSIEKTYNARKEFLEKCSKAPEVFKVKDRDGWYLTIEPDSVISLQNGQSAAQIKGYY
ncbi:MAG TPA: hypothetical protein DD381_13140 [Lentisphaeria bacterium]|nr:MAG: hypothetical protein A2X47_11615 [Lentisphaerae bacterium GWF2_38_69]HBM17267.1 hypothetical protein [Lentisphaeria bacterium]